MAANSQEILHDFSPTLIVYKDGRVERSEPPTTQLIVPASVDPQTGVRSEDVVISPETGVSARIFLPGKTTPAKKLPLLVYFHGGAFIMQSAFSRLYHKHLNFLVAHANVVAVSVDYRLAPEHLIPAAYDDSFLVLKWCVEDHGGESWIREFADLDRVYLCGDSAGGNIAHHIAVQIGSGRIRGLNLRGIVLNCPYFGGKVPIGDEDGSDEYVRKKKYMDEIWNYISRSESGCDDPRMNPDKDPRLSGLGCRRVLVYVGGVDFFKVRGLYYVEKLKESGWDGDVEVVEVAGEDHVFSVFFPESENGMAMLRRVAAFVNE